MLHLTPSSLFSMVEYKSQKRRWIPERNFLVVALYFLICIPITKGTPNIEFGDSSVDHWEFLFGASSKEFLYDFCKYNGTSGGLQCKNFHPVASVDFEKLCGCTIQHNGTITDGSFSFDLSCKSDLSYCPEELTLNYRQGSFARAPPQVPIHQGTGKNNNESPGNLPGSGTEADPANEMNEINGLLFFFMEAIVLLLITTSFCMATLKLHTCLKRMRNQSGSNSRINFSKIMAERKQVIDIDSIETGLLKIPYGDSENVDQLISTGDTHKRPEGVANLGFFESEIDGHITKQNADNVCVLVIHYDFKNDPKLFRSGHERDINNLKTSFGKNRNCNFRNFRSPNKKTLLQLLGDQEELLRFFNTQGDVPSVFMLFILSHGSENGKIWTDNFDRENNDYEYFTTDEVLDSLQNLNRFRKCLKIVNFGPCRGSLLDSMFDEKIQNKNSCRITTRPGMHNYVIFYSTVETTLANTDANGSWFVQIICACLNITDEEPLLKFFTIVQNRTHQAPRNKSEKNTPFGQTPELKMFTLDRKFTISRAIITAKPISNTDGSGEESKVRNDSLSPNFSWKSDEGKDIRGRRGFILSVVRSRQVQEMKRVLQNLDFEITDGTLTGQSLDFYRRMVSELEPDVGCIMTCLFGPVCENEENEVCVRVGQETRPITDILHSLVSPKNDKLIGKPKILIVANVQAPKIDSISAVDMKDLQVSATNHSGWLVLILKHEDALEKLIELFGNIGEKSLQELLEPLLARESNSEDAVLLNSTLQYLVNFPHWPRAFVKPEFKLKMTQIHRDQMDQSKNATKTPVEENIDFDALLTRAKRLFEGNKNSIESPVWTVSRPHVSSDIEPSKKSNPVRDHTARDDSTDASIVWLFNSVADAGKSTVLKEMAHQLTGFDKRIKILHILQKKYERYCLLEMPGVKVDEIKFLAKTTCNSRFDINNWIKKREVIVFLDGFDELCPYFREKMIKILIALNNARVPLFIGSRPHEAHHIQDRIKNTTIIEIQPLDIAKQIEFLRIVARKNPKEIEQLMKIYKEQDVLGNPLHLKLLAEYSGDRNLYETQ